MKATKTEVVEIVWPKLLIRHASGKRLGIITMQEAVERFGLDDRTVNWFVQGGLAGTRPAKNGKDIDMLELYTADDAIRDAAPDLLKVLEGIMDTDRIPKDSVLGKMALAAIKKARVD